MTTDFVMPSLGADMEVGRVVEWRVEPGDQVRRGDVIAVVDTDKSAIDVEVFVDAVVEELLVPVGDEVAVGTPLAHLRPLDEATTVDRTEPTEPTEPTGPAGPRPSEHVRASPLARRRADDAGLDLHQVVGHGPAGAVLAADVARTRPDEPGPATPAARDRSDRSTTMRQAIGALMTRSAREIPQYHVASTIDLLAASRWRADHDAGRPPAERTLMAALLLRATVRAALEVPGFNGVWDGSFRPSTTVDLGVAVALRGGGLVAPVIRGAEGMDLDALMGALRDLVARARGGRLRGSEVADPTITVTNLGDQGAEEVVGLVYPPQVAIVGFGRVVDRPWAVDGMVGVRPTVRAALTADHRVTDGRDASRFLASVDRHLQSPEEP